MATTYIKPFFARARQFILSDRFWAFLFACSISFVLLAQEETRGGSRTEETTGMFVSRNVDTNKVFIVPFEDRMYRSVADAAFMNEQKKTSEEVRLIYRKELTGRIVTELEHIGVEPNGGVLDADLADRIYKGLGYRNEKVEWPEEEKKGLKKFAPKKKKKEPTERTGTYINDGQIKTVRDTSTKIMVPVLIDPSLQPWMQENFGNGRTLFLTQFEIVPKYGLQYSGYGLDTATCTVQVHCSIFEEKKLVKSALISKNYSPCYSDQIGIIDKTFDDLAKKIAELFVTKEE